MANETKLGAAVLCLLLGVFGFLVFRKWSDRQTVAAAEVAAGSAESADGTVAPVAGDPPAAGGVGQPAEEGGAMFAGVEPAEPDVAADAPAEPTTGWQRPAAVASAAPPPTPAAAGDGDAGFDDFTFDEPEPPARAAEPRYAAAEQPFTFDEPDETGATAAAAAGAEPAPADGTAEAVFDFSGVPEPAGEPVPAAEQFAPTGYAAAAPPADDVEWTTAAADDPFGGPDAGEPVAAVPAFEDDTAVPDASTFPGDGAFPGDAEIAAAAPVPFTPDPAPVADEGDDTAFELFPGGGMDDPMDEQFVAEAAPAAVAPAPAAPFDTAAGTPATADAAIEFTPDPPAADTDTAAPPAGDTFAEWDAPAPAPEPAPAPTPPPAAPLPGADAAVVADAGAARTAGVDAPPVVQPEPVFAATPVAPSGAPPAGTFTVDPAPVQPTPAPDVALVDYNSTAPQPNAVTAAGGGTNRAYHEVRRGESYYTISKQEYGTIRYFRALARFNAHRIPDPRRLRPGMKVLLPSVDVLRTYDTSLPDPHAESAKKPAAKPGFRHDADGRPVYVSGKDDTLGGIAQRHLGRASRWRQVFELNRDRLSDPKKLRPGTVLRLPADAAAARRTPAK